MNVKLNRLSKSYLAALLKHLRQGTRASLQPAWKPGHQAVAYGLETLALARMHAGAVATLELPHSKNGLIRQVEIFFLSLHKFRSAKSRRESL
jgi:hypothetical protein